MGGLNHLLIKGHGDVDDEGHHEGHGYPDGGHVVGVQVAVLPWVADCHEPVNAEANHDEHAGGYESVAHRHLHEWTNVGHVRN